MPIAIELEKDDGFLCHSRMIRLVTLCPWRGPLTGTNFGVLGLLSTFLSNLLEEIAPSKLGLHK